jgi:ribosome-binding protein aMBF1 (putative translation factor)
MTMERAKFKKATELPPQRIKSPSGDEMVILPVKVYDAMVKALGRREDAADIAAANEVMARIESGKETVFPLDVVKKMRSQNRVAVLREHRGMTQKQLAERAGTDPMYISQIETGRARGGLDVMRNVAAALDVDLDILIPLRSTGAPTETGKRKPNRRGPSGRGTRG